MLPCRRCSPFRITESQDKISDQSPGIAAIRLVRLGLSPSIRHLSPGRHRTRGSWRKMGHRASQCLGTRVLVWGSDCLICSQERD
ncbi:hypothetical protein FOIG_08311 [Fusarium odoratissimum NRRL 54006]|uniref:Uncharacterized protein n=2 Tax=Fusarium oxysporum species complex TaxID=171631 RepID=X0JGP3_FUSO5|nr:uncharacterized protein FOIG_08311 [Fusarium odoratissimum NRRL 54006]EXM00353.1 hypothetical protein FOIG_08311 [Fusarium odoratissimum NRRL 54006]KAJ0152952.1 hypothetical protein HZ326_4698 [Fusarium oxysporum f. sp. albedinis]TXC12162.1 hypothetical protein FocTR4_00006689 [Fusarium oxysporum f. sp. cubense]